MIGDVVEMATALGFPGPADYVRWSRDCDPRILSAPTLEWGGLARTRDWIERGCPVPDRSSLAFVGAEAVRRRVRDVLAALPDPVAESVIRDCLVFGVDGTIPGFFTRLDLRAGQHVIVLTGFDDEDESYLAGIVAHEIGHHWLCDPSEPPPAPVAERIARERARAYVMRQLDAADSEERGTPGRRVDSQVQRIVQEEGLADACAVAWGFPERRWACGPGRFHDERKRIAAEAEGFERDLAADSEEE